MLIDRDLQMHTPAVPSQLSPRPIWNNLRRRSASTIAVIASSLLGACTASPALAQNLRFVPTIYTVQAFHNVLSSPGGMAADSQGKVYLADTAHSKVWMMDITQTVTLFAGRGPSTYTGDNGPAASATLSSPQAVATDLAGNVYIADSGNAAIRRVDASTGIITTIAGGNGVGSFGDGGPATAAKFMLPSGLAVDLAGNIYVSDSAAAVVRMISSSGTISTFAGGGSPSTGNGDGGPATSAKLQTPYGLAIDPSGALYIADQAAGLVRKVFGGTISTFAGSTIGFTIGTVGFGGPATSAKLHSPRALAVDPAGSVYIADSYFGMSALVDGTGTINVLAGLGVYGSVGDGLPASEVTLDGPYGIAVDPFGNVFLSSSTQNAVYEIIQHPERFSLTKFGTSSATQRLVLENLGTSSISLSGIAFTGDFASTSNYLPNPSPCNNTTVIGAGFGNFCTLDVIFTPSAPGIRSFPLQITSNDTPGTLTLTLNSIGLSSSLATSNGEIYTVAGLYPGDQFNRGDNILATLASLNGINGLTTDSAGDIILTEYGYCQIRRVDAKTGIISTLAGNNPDSCQFNAANGPNGDGGPATQATLYLVGEVVYGSDGTLYFADDGHYKIRSIDTQGIIHTYAGTGNNVCAWPGDGGVAASTAICGAAGLAFDSKGNFYYTDGSNEIIVRISPAGILTRVAGVPSIGVGSYSGDGGPALNAHLNNPWGIAVDKIGNIFFSDRASDIVRRIDATTGIITTVAGTPNVSGYSGDGGLATSATLNFAEKIALDNGGNLYITDSGNNVIRRVDATSGIITTVGGNNVLGDLYNGDGLPATETGVNYPETVTVDPSGYVLFGDRNRLIREISPSGTLHFAAQNLNTTSTSQTLIVSNIGNTAMHFDPTTPSTVVGDFALGSGTCDFTQPLAAGASCTVKITFTPTAIYTRYGALALYTDGVTSPQLTHLVGLGTAPSAPQAALSPTTLPFPNQSVNTTSAAATVTLSNPGTATLNISGISIAGADAAAFAKTSTCGATLAASAQCTISVTFTPSSIKAYSASLTVADDATGSPQAVALSGTGVNQQAQAVLTPASLAFSSVTGTTTASQTVVLSNPGTATLNISSIALTGANASAFGLTNGCGPTLAVSATCNLTVTFSPAAASAYTAAISVTDNAAGSPQSAPLTGTGTVAPTLLATLTPATIAFANQLSGTTSAAQTLTLTNTGNSSISITGATLTGANPTAFGLTSSCGSTLATGAQCSMAVTFKPSSVGLLSATVSVADNATGSPQTAALTGTGTAPAEFTTASPTPPQTVTSGGAATYQINVTSTTGNFNLPVTLTAAGLPPGATVAFTPAVVTPGASGATSTMVVQTSAVKFAGLNSLSPRRGQSGFELAITAMLTCLLCIRRMPRLPRTGRLLMMLWALALLTLGASGCGGGFPQPSGNNTFVITVTGTNGTDQHATNVTLTVQ